MAKASKPRQRYIFRRERGEGDDKSTNETTILASFNGWLKKAEPGDRFYVARCEWVECEVDEIVPFGDSEIAHVQYIEHVDAVENW